MNPHRIVRLVIAFVIGIALALLAYQRVSDPGPALQRAREEAVVLAARELLESTVAFGNVLEIVDPLATNRRVGKSYIYPTASGWEISGHYRRPGSDRWHPFLMSVDEKLQLVSLHVRDDDADLLGAAEGDPKLTVSGYPALGDEPQDHPDN